MSWLIITIAVFATWHLVYESIIAPTLRMHIRNQLFEQRDRLRRLRIDGDIESAVFEVLQGTLNNGIAFLHLVAPSMVAEFRNEIRRNDGLRRKVEKRQNLIESCACEEALAINRKTAELLDHALITNSGGWAIYVVPFVIARVCRDTVDRSIRGLLAVPEKDALRLFDPGGPAVA